MKICYNKSMKMKIPEFVKVCLWSYDTDMIDFSVPDHRIRVVQNVLNHGTSEAVSWLRKTFPEEEIKEIIEKSISSDWNKKSLALWSLIFNIYPSKEKRFL